MKLFYCAFKPHFKDENEYYTNGSFPYFIPELSKYFDRLYLMVPIANYLPKGMSKLKLNENIEVVETRLYKSETLRKMQYYTWSLNLYNILLFKKYLNRTDFVLIAIPSSIIYAAFIPFINKPLVTLIAGDEQEVIKASNNIIFRMESKIGFLKIRGYVEKYLVKKSSIIICRSYKFKNKLINEYNIEDQKIHVITSGVNTDLFRPFDSHTKEIIKSNLGINGKNIVIGFVATNLSYQKGVDILLESFKKILTKCKNVTLLLIGDNTMGLQNSDSVIICGTVKKEELPNYYNAMDIFVFPSRSEGAPKVVMEAGSCGVPTISTNIGGIPEILLEGENGFLVESENIDAIADYCILLIKDQILRENMGKKSRLQALNRFDFEKLAKNFYIAINSSK